MKSQPIPVVNLREADGAGSDPAASTAPSQATEPTMAPDMNGMPGMEH